MKIFKYLTAALIALFAWSCADEGPETMGSLEIKCSVDNVRSRSAEVILTLPKSDEQLISQIGDCWLVGPDGESYYQYDDYENDTETALVKDITFTQLAPSTTYTIMVSVYGSFNDELNFSSYYDSERYERQLGTLTTLSDSEAYTTDYLLVSNDCAAFNLSLDLSQSEFAERCIRHVLVSKNSDISDPTEFDVYYPDNRSMGYNPYHNAASVCTSDNEDPTVTITIPALEPGTKYYYAVELEIPYDYNHVTVTPGNNSFTTTRQPAEILKSMIVSPKLELLNPDYDPDYYTFTCNLNFGNLSVIEGYIFLNGDTNDNLHFYEDKEISYNLYIYDSAPISYSLGMIIDFVKDGVKYTANGITYTPEDNTIQIPSAK